MKAGQVVVMCEGYDDRAFLAGWLKHLGWRDMSVQQGKEQRVRPRDPNGKEIERGAYGFESPSSGAFARICPVEGRGNLLARFRSRMRDILVDRIGTFVIAMDSDRDDATTNDPIADGFALSNLLAECKKEDPSASEGTGDCIVVAGGACKARLLVWKSPEPPAPDLPSKQTIERLIAGVFRSCHLDRHRHIHNWLDNRPSPPKLQSGKEFTWSIMAGWHAKEGCARFFEAVWEDDCIRKELETHLAKLNLLNVLKSL